MFKDEVRAVGAELGLPEAMVWRHPFPGPGLAIRCLGEVTWERLERLRLADSIMQSELAAADIEVHVVHCLDATKFLGNISDRNDVFVTHPYNSP